jgi:outer membrane immunogenic protein
VSLGAAPAMAADVVVMGQRPVSVGAFSWTSWYVGGLVGAGWSNQASTSEPCSSAPPFVGCWLSVAGGQTVSYPLSTNAIGGVTAGYNYQIPGSAIVFGLETEFGYLHLTGSSSFAAVSPARFAPNLVADTTIGDWYNATAARIGWAWENLLFYGKGGFAVSTIESTIFDARGLSGTGKKDIFGWAWGAGLEYAFNPRWSVKAEYLWLGLNHSVGVCAAVSPAFVSVGGTFCSNTTTEAVQTFKVGVNYLLDVGPVYDRY